MERHLVASLRTEVSRAPDPHGHGACRIPRQTQLTRFSARDFPQSGPDINVERLPRLARLHLDASCFAHRLSRNCSYGCTECLREAQGDAGNGKDQEKHVRHEAQ